MDSTHFAVFPSNLGWMSLVWNDRRLVELTFGHPSAAESARATRCRSASPGDPLGTTAELWIARLQAYAHGEHSDNFLDVDLDVTGLTEFQQKVLRACRRIPAGRTVTYGELARRAGHPQAARAAGQVMATNRFPLIVPCHRVVAAGGLLGGYSAPQGLAMKRRLLADEGVTRFGRPASSSPVVKSSSPVVKAQRSPARGAAPPIVP
jgi:methylated-DNA-[protein]-cysteine S-methyltransferase